MDYSIFPSDNGINLRKHGMSGCHGDYLSELGRENDYLCLVAMQQSMIRRKQF